MPDILKIPAVFVRGGTSRAVFFHSSDLKDFSSQQIDSILLTVLGSPDNSGRQVDGLGGGFSSLSKAAIISPSNMPDIDIDFNFAQVSINSSFVDWSGTCGNISSAVGPFAINEGLVESTKPVTELRVRSVNTGKTFLCGVPVSEHGPISEGDFAIDGVPGTASRIYLKFYNPGGSLGKGVLPTKSPIDNIKIPSGEVYRTSVIDVGIPTIFVLAEELNHRMTATLEDLDSDWETKNILEDIRCVMIEPKSSYIARDKKKIDLDLIDLRAIAISMNQAHRTYPVSVSMATAAAAHMSGTLVSELTKNLRDRELCIGHPNGVMKVEIDVLESTDGWKVRSVTIFRTSRTIMEGKVNVPFSKLITN